MLRIVPVSFGETVIRLADINWFSMMVSVTILCSLISNGVETRGLFKYQDWRTFRHYTRKLRCCRVYNAIVHAARYVEEFNEFA
jgi:hypothetical protein